MQGEAPGASWSLVTTIGGSATATGTSTIATGSVDTSAHDNGHASIARGDASFEAASTGTTPSADVATFFDVSGADVVVMRESGGSTQQASAASAGSALQFVAIANGSQNPHGPVIIDVQLPYHDHGQSFAASVSDGNYAAVSATADAHGSQTTAVSFATASTVENQYSFVQAASLVAV